MCIECGNESHVETFAKGMITGTEIGINHLDYLDTYYTGLNQYAVEYDVLKKHVSISPAGITTKYGEEPIDKYMQELLEELRVGLRTGDKREHIKNIFLKFSDRKFQDKAWWGNLTELEIEELLKGVRDFYLPHTAMLDAGLSEAFIFGKFTKQLTESMSLEDARKKIRDYSLSKFDLARIDSIQNTSHLFWNKAIQRESDSAAIKLLEYNRDVTTEILKNPNRKTWRSLTSDIYHSIKKDETIVMRDLDRITRTETAYSQNFAILVGGKERGSKYFFVFVRPTACKLCKGMYLDEKGKPKKFVIDDFIDQPRNINWGKRKGDTIVDQPPPLHSWCFCKILLG